jgi:hypothetical protein
LTVGFVLADEFDDDDGIDVDLIIDVHLAITVKVAIVRPTDVAIVIPIPSIRDDNDGITAENDR